MGTEKEGQEPIEDALDEQQTAEPGAPPSDEQSNTGDDWREKELEKARREAARYRTELRKLEADQAKAQEAKLAEEQKWRELAEKREAEREALKAEMERERLNNLRLQIAMEKNLPARLATRLVGTSREEMEADADEILSLMPKPPEPQRPIAPNIDSQSVPPAKAPPNNVKLTQRELEIAERAGMTPEEYAKWKQ